MSRRVLRGGDFAVELLGELPPGGTAAWMERQGRVLKQDRHSTVVLATLRGEYCCLKYYAAKSWVQSAGFRLGIGRAVQAFDSAVQLEAAGIAVPVARACLLLADGMLLVTEGLAEGRDFKQLWLQGPVDSGEHLLQEAGASLARLHAGGFAHGDCKWSNLFWLREQCYFLDLEAVSRPGRRGGRQYRDLARFTLNAEELGIGARTFQAFLDAYCGGTGLASDELLAGMRGELVRLRRRHRAKYGERGAPLV